MRVVAWLVVVASSAGAPAFSDTPIQDHERLRRASARFEEVAGPLDPGMYAPGVPQAYDNAATALLEAALLTPRDREERGRLQDLSKKAAAKWSAGDVEAARRLVNAQGRVLSLLDRATSRGGSRFPIDYGEGTFANPPPLLRILDAARIAAVDARLALRENDPNRACLGVERAGAVARAFQAESMLIVFLVGLAAERMQLELAAELAAFPGLDEAAWNRVDAAILSNDPAKQARRSVALDFAALAARIGGTPGAERLAADFLDHGSDLIEAATGDWSLAHAAVDRVAGSARRCREVDAQDEATRRGITTVHEVLGTWTGPFSRAAAVDTGREVVRFALEVRRRGLRDGAYPSDVTDDPATATPLSLSGRPLRVERSEDGTATVEAEGAEEAWLSQHGDDTPAPPFRVLLPAITPPALPEPASAPSKGPAARWGSSRRPGPPDGTRPLQTDAVPPR